jgi:signal transduction histidine kinase
MTGVTIRANHSVGTSNRVIMPNMGPAIEPGLIRTYRYFAAIAMFYFAIISGYVIIIAVQGGFMYIQSAMNFVINLFLFIYLSIPWLERKLKKLYLPFSLVSYAGATVFTNLIYLIDPNKVDLYLIIARSWVLVPILIVPLVLIAWQYSFRYVMLFTIFTNAVELFVLVRIVRELTFETVPILGLPLIRAFAFGVIGHIVVRLMDTQRRQKHRLIQTNIRLGQYANTLEQLAISRERNRLARELHDTLAHTLSGLAVNLEGIETMLSPDQKEIQAMLDQSLCVTRMGLEETRRALQDLRARPLDDLGLDLALRNLIHAAADRASFITTTDISSDLSNLPTDVEQSIYRILQETMENIVRHANATQVAVSLKTEGNRVELTIKDDGDGFDSKKIPSNSQFGIQGIRERAAIVGGTLSITSQIGKGSTVQFAWEKLDDQSSDL